MMETEGVFPNSSVHSERFKHSSETVSYKLDRIIKGLTYEREIQNLLNQCLL